jgi:hypothetical protein
MTELGIANEADETEGREPLLDAVKQNHLSEADGRSACQ